ncbi:Putative transposable element, partial [Caligus rogercresseyi]
METKRHEIAVMICAHHDTSDIVRIVGVDCITVYRDRPQSGRPVKLTLGDARTAFKDNSKMTMTEFAEKKFVAMTTIFNAVKAKATSHPEITYLNGGEHEALAQGLLAATESGSQPAGLQCPVAFHHGNVKDLKASVDKEWDAMSECYVANVCTAFQRRVEAVIKCQ